MDNMAELNMPPDKVAVILVDHGSRREESNQLLLDVVDAFREHSQWSIVEPAHMELAEPTIATAFARCVEQGAELVIVFPYFLAPGRHRVKHFVTAPLGLHTLIMQVIDERIATCLKRFLGEISSCDSCTDSTGCTLNVDSAPRS
jgi:sirohydrochlorin ferrochelatase